jgi:hypothetical protein
VGLTPLPGGSLKLRFNSFFQALVTLSDEILIYLHFQPNKRKLDAQTHIANLESQNFRILDVSPRARSTLRDRPLFFTILMTQSIKIRKDIHFREGTIIQASMLCQTFTEFAIWI